LFFKLMTLPDTRVSTEANEHVTETAKRKIGRQPTKTEVAEFLSGECEGAFRETRGSGMFNVWTRARNALKRLEGLAGA
jgi:hypothetical protein